MDEEEKMLWGKQEINPVYFYNLWREEQKSKRARTLNWAEEEGNPAYFIKPAQQSNSPTPTIPSESSAFSIVKSPKVIFFKDSSGNLNAKPYNENNDPKLTK